MKITNNYIVLDENEKLPSKFEGIRDKSSFKTQGKIIIDLEGNMLKVESKKIYKSKNHGLNVCLGLLAVIPTFGLALIAKNIRNLFKSETSMKIARVISRNKSYDLVPTQQKTKLTLDNFSNLRQELNENLVKKDFVEEKVIIVKKFLADYTVSEEDKNSEDQQVRSNYSFYTLLKSFTAAYEILRNAALSFKSSNELKKCRENYLNEINKLMNPS